MSTFIDEAKSVIDDRKRFDARTQSFGDDEKSVIAEVVWVMHDGHRFNVATQNASVAPKRCFDEAKSCRDGEKSAIAVAH